jgi:hypothetical protein
MTSPALASLPELDRISSRAGARPLDAAEAGPEATRINVGRIGVHEVRDLP